MKEERKEQLESLSNKILKIRQNYPDIAITFEEYSLLHQSNVIYIHSQTKLTFQVYHFESRRFASLNFGMLKSLSSYAFVQVRDDLFVSGGFDSVKIHFSGSLVKVTYKNLEDVTLSSKANMLIAKTRHKMVLLNLKMIYCIGGKSKDKRYLSHCERYDIEENKWEVAPPLNEGRINLGVVSVNGLKIYVFGGYNGSKMTSIEALSVTAKKSKWSTVKLAGSKGWSGKEDLGCLQVNDYQVLIFGGIKDSIGCETNVFLFDLVSNKMELQDWTLERKDWFSNGSPVKLKGSALCMAGSFMGDVHVLSGDPPRWSAFNSEGVD
eukprot:TRINITY_DN6368_c0_g1_i2.p1 TRINITY_DN6368_c0_g1~~TRINITY_DN6368_c0_g1_i2.p1  ORF type:complete len:322 (-),score=97.88 TRINITY_DN6368_c0_g1_i2:105-1070(-)